MNPSQTLRTIANTMSDGELKDRLFQLAAELEVQHRQQNSAFQGALSNAELGIGNQLDALTAMIGEVRSVCNGSASKIVELCEKFDALAGRIRDLEAREAGRG